LFAADGGKIIIMTQKHTPAVNLAVAVYPSRSEQVGQSTVSQPEAARAQEAAFLPRLSFSRTDMPVLPFHNPSSPPLRQHPSEYDLSELSPRPADALLSSASSQSHRRNSSGNRSSSSSARYSEHASGEPEAIIVKARTAKDDSSPRDQDWIERFRIETRFRGDDTIEIHRHGQSTEVNVWKREDERIGYEYSSPSNLWLEKCPENGKLRVVKVIMKGANYGNNLKTTAATGSGSKADQAGYDRELKILALVRRVSLVKHFQSHFCTCGKN
jgi:hypothetical protein